MAKDPYKYFRVEARELLDGLARELLALEKGASGKETVGRLLRLAHTLKGAARVVKQPTVADMAHKTEDVLAPFRDGEAAVTKAAFGEALALVDGMSAAVAALKSAEEIQEASGAAARPPAAPPATEAPFETVRLDIGELDALLEGLCEASAQLSRLRRDGAGFDRAVLLAERLLEQTAAAGPAEKTRALAQDLRDALRGLGRTFGSGLEGQERELAALRESADALRLLPAAGLFAPLERVVRDAAQALGKEVDFEAVGGGVRLDGHVLQAVRDCFVHVLRNAVGHGIETAAERAAASKPPRGRVALAVERRGHRVAFICSDDGRGLDVAGIRRVALARGLAEESELNSLGLEEAVRLILHGGVSTTGRVTELSGRGVGLDAVRAAAERLKGELRVSSRPGAGATVELIVPVTLSSQTVLTAVVDGQAYGLPLDSIRGVLLIRDADIARSPDGDSAMFQDRSVPLLPLARALKRPRAAAAGDGAGPALVLEHRGQRAAFSVDSLRGAASVLVRPAPALAAARALVSGVTFDADGHPQLVLDAAALLAASAERGAAPAVPSPEKRPPVLIIDDSMTTRMLEASILESAGYEVELAVSAEEAMAKSRQSPFSLFLVDVEMPGMNGFEFVAAAAADAALRGIPAILVSSRNAPEDLRRGREAGAKAYMVKSEFNQEALLQTIRGLIG